MNNETTILLSKAPVGGAISRVNGAFYEGGQFMPETGMFCGAIKQAKKYADVTGKNWAEISVSYLMVYVRCAGESKSSLLVKKPFSSKEEAAAFVNEVIRLRAESYISKGLRPHPTAILV